MSNSNAALHKGPKYTLDIEGTLHSWDQPTITMEQIAELGGWNPSEGVILIDKDNNERSLSPGEVVELKPGMGFAKKVHFKRGLQAQHGYWNQPFDSTVEVFGEYHDAAY
jgi:hypothetical protein